MLEKYRTISLLLGFEHRMGFLKEERRKGSINRKWWELKQEDKNAYDSLGNQGGRDGGLILGNSTNNKFLF